MSDKDGKAKVLISNPSTDSEIDFLDGLDEIFDTDVVTEEKVMFLVPKLSSVVLTKEVKKLIYDALAFGISQNYILPFTVLVPKKLITRRDIPVGEIPIPFGSHTLIIVPHIREIMVYEQWKE